MTQSVCKRFTVSGKVQGVFFRASTARRASRLGLKGWAVNLPDGRVDVVAYGSPEGVDQLSAWLAKGPPGAQVMEVTTAPGDDVDCTALDGFRTG